MVKRPLPHIITLSSINPTTTTALLSRPVKFGQCKTQTADWGKMETEGKMKTVDQE